MNVGVSMVSNGGEQNDMVSMLLRRCCFEDFFGRASCIFLNFGLLIKLLLSLPHDL
jgi:hypothetical protein